MRITSFYNLVSESSYSPPIWAALVAGFFVMVTVTLSAYLLFEHLSAYKNPEVGLIIRCVFGFMRRFSMCFYFVMIFFCRSKSF